MAGGCVRYQPAPLRPSDFVARQAIAALPIGTPATTAALLPIAIDAAPALRESRDAYRSALAAAKAARVPLPAAFQLTAEYSRDDNPGKPWLGAGAIDLPLDFGGRRNVRVAAADLAAVQALYDYGEAVWTVRSTIRHALIERAFADRIAPLAAEALALRQRRHAAMQARVARGEEANGFALLGQTELATAERRVRDAAGRRAQADVALARAIGMDAPAVASLTAVDTGPLPAFTAADLTGWRAEATAGRRDVLRAIVDYDTAENALRQEVIGQYPALRLQAGYTYERGLVKLPFGLALALPPVDLNRANIRAAEARRAQAGAKLEATQAAVLLEVDKALATFTAQRNAETVTRDRDVPAARHLADATAASRRNGEIDRIEEDGARVALIETQVALLDAERASWLALADLEDALRRPFDPADWRAIEAAMARLRGTQ